jgi:hypothetical protein
MIYAKQLVVFALLVLALAGCPSAPIDPGSEALVVETERATSAAFATYKHVIEYDHANLDFMKQHAPAAHEAIQQIRRDYPAIHRALRQSIRDYKALRSVQNAELMKTNLDDALAQQKIAQDALADETKARTEAAATQPSQ